MEYFDILKTWIAFVKDTIFSQKKGTSFQFIINNQWEYVQSSTINLLSTPIEIMFKVWLFTYFQHSLRLC